MAMSYRLTLRNARLDAITTDAGASALIRIYSGTAPANVGTALSGNTLLAELACSASAFAAAASGGVLTLNTVASAAALATGTAVFFRVYKSDGTTAVIQGTVTATGGGGDMTIANVSIVSGATVSLTSNTITTGNA
jgi:hypothetical protein